MCLLCLKKKNERLFVKINVATVQSVREYKKITNKCLILTNFDWILFQRVFDLSFNYQDNIIKKWRKMLTSYKIRMFEIFSR